MTFDLLRKAETTISQNKLIILFCSKTFLFSAATFSIFIFMTTAKLY